jgi:predicted transcriptional regulator
VYRLGEATAAEVRAEIPDPPGYDAVRTTMRLLEDRQLLVHRQEGRRYVYRAVHPRRRAARDALRHLLRTFFDDSPERAATALLRMADGGKDPQATLERLRAMLKEEEE